MGRDQRPTAACHGLMLAATLLLAGCANSNVQVSTGGTQPAVSAPGGSTLGTLVLLGLIAGLAYESDRGRTLDGPPPPLDPERRVLEQDCTKPIEDWSANLRCR